MKTKEEHNDYLRQWRQNNPNYKEYNRLKMKKWREENRERYNELEKNRRQKNHEEWLKWNREYNHRPERIQKNREDSKKKYVKLKTLVLNRYGNQCKYCGECGFSFLTIDHVDNNGASERRKLGLPAGVPF